MLEIVFSDSAKAAIIAAKKYKSRLRQNADGCIGEIACIGLNFDIGDIAGELDGAVRKRELARVFSSVRFSEKELESFFLLQREDFEKTLCAAKYGEPIRAWISNAPFSVFAFAFLCNALRDFNCRLSVIELPMYYENNEASALGLSDWSELTPRSILQIFRVGTCY